MLRGSSDNTRRKQYQASWVTNWLQTQPETHQSSAFHRDSVNALKLKHSYYHTTRLQNHLPSRSQPLRRDQQCHHTMANGTNHLLNQHFISLPSGRRHGTLKWRGAPFSRSPRPSVIPALNKLLLLYYNMCMDIYVLCIVYFCLQIFLLHNKSKSAKCRLTGGQQDSHCVGFPRCVMMSQPIGRISPLPPVVLLFWDRYSKWFANSKLNGEGESLKCFKTSVMNLCVMTII